MTMSRVFIVGSLALAGCQDVIDLDPLDETPPIEARVRPAPIIGGTLTLAGDDLAIAADPDRDLIHVVDVDARAVRHTIPLEPGDQPGRVAIGGEGRAHVILRGFGGLATVDLAAGTVLARHPLCPEPRGIAFDDADATLHVACAGGSLLHLSEAGELLDRRELEPDLRDVLLVDGQVWVSTFRSAALLGPGGARLTIPATEEFAPHVAWRTWVSGDGEITMLHQLASVRPVPVNPDPEDLPEDGSPYGGGGFCETGIVNAAITTFASDGSVTTTPVIDSRLTVDAALSPDGQWVAMAAPGAIRPDPKPERRKRRRDFSFEFGDEFFQSTLRIDRKHEQDCFPMASDGDLGQVTAVAFAAGGRLVMQSREPARLMVMEDGPGSELDVIDLQGEPRFDTGHEIFHRATDSGLSCASCHPEGTDDGHVWDFQGLGPRRTQALDVGLADTAPFHWDGDMADFDTLMAEVLAHRMGGKRQSPARGDSFTRWMFEQQRPPADAGLDDPGIVATGEALFTTYECSKCHDGPALGGQRTETIAGVDKQVPTLRRISLHPPFMHDGRSPTLEAAVRDMIETTRSTSAPEADIAAIAAYLRTL